ncbi:MAG: hypothetical protein LKM37_01415 [Bacteroidales bacterium]|nr:hypothetical protein [Bacteroidales bacterium]MCI1733123.1 hypothetical protein [Bacteroidales bacterium]
MRGKKKQHRKKQANPYKSFPEKEKSHVDREEEKSITVKSKPIRTNLFQKKKNLTELQGKKKQHRKKQANPYKSFPEKEKSHVDREEEKSITVKSKQIRTNLFRKSKNIT